MSRVRIVSSALTLCLLAGGSAATAASIEVSDPAGDGLKGHALDITSVKVSNRARAIFTTISVVRATHGDLAVYYWPKDGTRNDVTGVLSTHRVSGDVNKVVTIAGKQHCPGLAVVWNHEADVLKVRLPAACMHDGRYRAVRIRVITEIGSDADIAPKTPNGAWGWTPYVSRG